MDQQPGTDQTPGWGRRKNRLPQRRRLNPGRANRQKEEDNQSIIK